MARAFWLPAALMALALLALQPGCSHQRFDGPPRLHETATAPSRLSDWRLLRPGNGAIELNAAAIPYAVNMPLFSDYADKHRALWVPEGRRIEIGPDESLQFPDGAIISKSFYYDSGHPETARPALRPASQRFGGDQARVLETRLLVREDGRWVPLSYLWEGDDARLITTGAVIDLPLTKDATQTFPYVVPTRNECAKCHALDHVSEQLEPIGLTLAQLTAGTSESGLQAMIDRGWLPPASASTQPMPRWQDFADSALTAPQRTEQARAYLDSNCAHCHSPTGSARNSGLHLGRFTPYGRALGVCKPPIAAGKGSGGRLFSIVPGQPHASIVSYRMASTDPSRRMPENGRTLAHSQGNERVDQWIASLSGECL